ncbi:MAG: glutathione S-transferase family protein [Maricaulaceae bacterium]|jgi:glutathione S-transferase
MKHLCTLLAAALALTLTATRLAAQEPAAEADAPRIEIYHAEGRRSERIVWLCEELGLPYELHYVRGDVGASFAAIREVNPDMAVAPTVIYNGEVLMESASIMQLLLDRHGDGRLVPPVDSPDYPAHLRFMHFAEGSLAADVVADYRVARATDGRAPWGGRETDGQRAVRYADSFLAEHPYFGGEEFSAADIMMVFPLAFAVRMNVADAALYPHVAEWNARVEARPAFQRMLAAARPDGRVAPPAPLTVE